MKMFLPLATTILAVGITPLYAAETPSERPNFVVIYIDDMGYGDIGPFGSKVNRTPNLDRMAAEGMKLTSFYCAPVCTASRAQLMSGSYCKRVGLGGALMPVSKVGISANEKLVPEWLKPQGYATMCIGKWHLGDQPEFLPTRHGFDHYLGLPYSNDMGGENTKEPTGPVAHSLKGKEMRPPLPLIRDDKVIEAPVEQTQLTELYTKEAVKFITENKQKPFFLYLPHAAVHVPLNPGKAFAGKSQNGAYGDWVEEVDWSVGQILDTLRALKLDQKTMVLFTSDNGPWLSFGDKAGVAGPLKGGKFSCWEGGMREPTLAWWPGKIPAGSTCDAITSNIDVLPTLVGLSGSTLPKDLVIDGRDLWPLLSGKSKQSPHEALYYFGGQELGAVRSGEWKLITAPQKTGKEKNKEEKKEAKAKDHFTPQLYNLDKDIGETTDVAAEYPEVVKKMQQLVELMDKDLGVRGKGPGVRPAGEVENPKPLLKRDRTEYD